MLSRESHRKKTLFQRTTLGGMGELSPTFPTQPCFWVTMMAMCLRSPSKTWTSITDLAILSQNIVFSIQKHTCVIGMHWQVKRTEAELCNACHVWVWGSVGGCVEVYAGTVLPNVIFFGGVIWKLWFHSHVQVWFKGWRDLSVSCEKSDPFSVLSFVCPQWVSSY